MKLHSHDNNTCTECMKMWLEGINASRTCEIHKCRHHVFLIALATMLVTWAFTYWAMKRCPDPVRPQTTIHYPKKPHIQKPGEKVSILDSDDCPPGSIPSHGACATLDSKTKSEDVGNMMPNGGIPQR